MPVSKTASLRSFRHLPRTLLCTLSLAMTFPATTQARETLEMERIDAGQLVKLKPEVYWPKGSGPFGLVLVVNSSSGASDIFLTVAVPPMIDAGIAVATLDTFTPRGVSGTAVDQGRVSSTQMAVDALHVAEALRKDKRVRPGKIAVLGQSKGGVTALHLATAAWREYSSSSLPAFDAAIAVAPSCELQFRDPRLAAPLLALLAEKDDYAVPGPCVKYLGRMKEAGQDAEWEVVPKVGHSWSTHGTQYVANLYSARKCADEPFYYTAAGFESSRTGILVPMSQILQYCEARGATVGGPGDKRSHVLGRAAGWLKRRGW